MFTLCYIWSVCCVCLIPLPLLFFLLLCCFYHRGEYLIRKQIMFTLCSSTVVCYGLVLSLDCTFQIVASVFSNCYFSHLFFVFLCFCFCILFFFLCLLICFYFFVFLFFVFLEVQMLVLLRHSTILWSYFIHIVGVFVRLYLRWIAGSYLSQKV